MSSHRFLSLLPLGLHKLVNVRPGAFVLPYRYCLIYLESLFILRENALLQAKHEGHKVQKAS